MRIDTARHICLAWLLHDILEDTNVTTEQELKEKYLGKRFYDLVLANTKNMDIADKVVEKIEDLISRMFSVGRSSYCEMCWYYG
jgi:(p)ppGpp synthase/HD superfamily hydrolase